MIGESLAGTFGIGGVGLDGRFGLTNTYITGGDHMIPIPTDDRLVARTYRFLQLNYNFRRFAFPYSKIQPRIALLILRREVTVIVGALSTASIISCSEAKDLLPISSALISIFG